MLSKLAALDADLSEKRAKKNRLESEVRMCSIKLDRAQKLISGLGGEKSRWTAAAALLGQQLQRLTGDVLLAAAQIAYLGEPGAVVLSATASACVPYATLGSNLPQCFSSAPLDCAAGPFTSVYRAECLESWVKACEAAHVPCSSKFSLPAALGNPVTIRQWNAWGLPKDDFSTENAIAMEQGRRWPLCIDPQVSA